MAMHDVEILEIVLVTLAILAALGLLLWSIHTIRYSITPPYLRVTWLGLCVRRLHLGDIKHITIRPTGWSEKWYSTWFPRNRLLVIERHSGLIRNFSITPRNHFVFKAELERARQELGLPPSGPGTAAAPTVVAKNAGTQKPG